MRVKGNVILARKAFVEKHFGADAWAGVLRALPADDQAVLSGVILNIRWFPFDLGARLDAAIVQTLGKGRPETFEQIGRISADENLGGAHKDFLKPGDPHAFLRQTPMIYDFYYDTGRRTYERAGEDGGVLTTYDATTFSQMDCLTVIGWHKRALEMCGAKAVRIEEEACRAKGNEYCRYRVRWTL
jgi:hypothetical protein